MTEPKNGGEPGANGNPEGAETQAAPTLEEQLAQAEAEAVDLKDRLLRDRVLQEILAAYLADNVKARFLQKDGRYLRAWQSAAGRSKRPPRGRAAFSAQEFLIALAEGKESPENIPAPVQPGSSRATGVRASGARGTGGRLLVEKD